MLARYIPSLCVQLYVWMYHTGGGVIGLVCSEHYTASTHRWVCEVCWHGFSQM